MDWASKVDAKGLMWATPGPYLRESMLKNLARHVSDHYLPEVFYKNMTFTEADGCPARSAEEEDTLALSLAVRMKDEADEREKRAEAEDEDEDERDDDDD
jgi:hypothetical protein